MTSESFIMLKFTTSHYRELFGKAIDLALLIVFDAHQDTYQGFNNTLTKGKNNFKNARNSSPLASSNSY